MTGSRARNLDRIEETQDGLTDLRTRVTTWFGDRRERDKPRQYWTQLDGLERVLLPSIEQVQKDVDKSGPRADRPGLRRLPPKRPAGEPDRAVLAVLRRQMGPAG